MESDLDDLPLTEAAPVSKMSKIPGLSFGGPPAEGPTQSKAQSMQLGLPLGLGAKAPAKPGGSLGFGIGIDLSKLGNKEDYQDEFMAKYDEFSESWRQLLKKDKRF